MLCIKCMTYHNLGWIFISLVIQTIRASKVWNMTLC